MFGGCVFYIPVRNQIFKKTDYMLGTFNFIMEIK